MCTTTVFLNPCATALIWALAHIVGKCEATEGILGSIIAPPPLMPKLMTLEAGKLAAVSALHLARASSSLNLPITLDVGTPDHILITVDLDR